MKTIAEIATPFDDSDPEELDFYMGSTFGFDFIMGQEVIEGLKPYVSLGFTDASTFFYIGDDGVVGNNGDPYASFTGSWVRSTRQAAWNTRESSTRPPA